MLAENSRHAGLSSMTAGFSEPAADMLFIAAEAAIGDSTVNKCSGRNVPSCPVVDMPGPSSPSILKDDRDHPGIEDAKSGDVAGEFAARKRPIRT